MKGGGEVLAVLTIDPSSRVHGVAVAEQPITGPEMIGAFIDAVLNLALQNQRQLNLRVPVPEKGAALVSGEQFPTQMDRKRVIPMLFQFFFFFINLYLHKRYSTIELQPIRLEWELCFRIR